MWEKFKTKAQDGYAVAKTKAQDGVAVADKGLTKFINEAPQAFADGIGVRKREQQYVGTVEVQVDLPGKTRLVFCRSSPPMTQIKMEEVEQGGKTTFDPGETEDFDFLLIVNYLDRQIIEERAHVVRSGVYRVHQSPSPEPGAAESATKPLIVDCIKRPERINTNLLANLPGISFGFAASGWLFVYQLGVAECLQNNGICRNPYVKVAGASGGALTGMLMMYGADLQQTRDYIKEKAQDARSDAKELFNLRSFVLGAMKKIIKDGSYLHPVFQSQRLEICFSEAAEKTSILYSTITSKTKQRRMKEFKNSSDAAIALLASSTMGISGMPFEWTNEEGKPVKVADGAVCEFLPDVDEFSIKCMAFTDFLGLSGKKNAEVMPTEFVPSNYGVRPPAVWICDHLYELGYQDMSTWLELHLSERLAEIEASGKGALPTNLPPVDTFKCPDDGLTWLDGVRDVVPGT